MLTEFSEDAAGRLRMEEGDIQTLSTLAGLLVDQAYTLFRNLCQTFGNTVLYAECYVMNTLVAFVKPLLNGALG